MYNGQTHTRLLVASIDACEYQRLVDLFSQVDGWEFELEWEPDDRNVMARLLRGSYHCCLAAYALGERNGLDLLREVKQRGCDVPIILLMPAEALHLCAQAIADGAADFLIIEQLRPLLLERSVCHAVGIHCVQAALVQARAEIDQRKTEVAALLQGARGVLESQDFVETARSILESCKDLIGANGGLVFMLGDDGQNYEVLVSHPEHVTSPIDPTLLRSLYGKQRPAAVGAAEFRGRENSDFMRPDYRGSILIAPMIIVPRTVGLLIFTNKEIPFTDNDATVAAAFGELAALALHHYRTRASLEIGFEFFRSVVETANDAVISSDSHGEIVFWNHGAEKIFGYGAEEIVGRPLRTIIPQNYWPAHAEGIKRVLASGRRKTSGKTMEVAGVRKDGGLVPIELSIATWKTRDEILFTGIGRDVTDRKNAERALRQAKDEAEIANRAKSEFLANMSHEIRTPLNAIIGMADLLWESPLTEEQKQHIELLRSAGDTLLNLINDILDISKVEAGHALRLESQEFDPGRLVERTCEVMALRAHEKGLELLCQIMPEVPDRVLGDPHRLRQILVNLLGNAIKFTQQGEIVVRLEQAGGDTRRGGEEGSAKADLLFSVADTGIGVPPEKNREIFQEFAQAHRNGVNRFGGTGLGLAISRHLVELMEGKIWVESEIDKGSTFFFTGRFDLPDEADTAKASSSLNLNGLRVLIVDDNATNRMILRDTLTSWGMKVVDAEGGISALESLRAARDAARPFHLVLIDCRMPGMGGFELVECIENESGLAEITIMILTSDHRHNDTCRCRRLGVAATLIKPVKRADLLEAIHKALERKWRSASPENRPAETPEQRTDSGPGTPMDILLVEDSVDNCLLVKAFLKKSPHRLDIAENGEAGVKMFKEKDYDLVLMDMQMPVMDGYTATRVIRQWEKDREERPTPIIALTAYAFEEDIEKSRAAGCTAHLTKPVKKAVLLQEIEKYAPQARPLGSPVVAGQQPQSAFRR
jgi:two-component system sensor histidine kinase/response regulator